MSISTRFIYAGYARPSFRHKWHNVAQSFVKEEAERIAREHRYNLRDESDQPAQAGVVRLFNAEVEASLSPDFEDIQILDQEPGA